jgi:hypothetical protein
LIQTSSGAVESFIAGLALSLDGCLDLLELVCCGRLKLAETLHERLFQCLALGLEGLVKELETLLAQPKSISEENRPHSIHSSVTCSTAIGGNLHRRRFSFYGPTSFSEVKG